MALTITKDNFEAEVLNSEKPVLVDFWAIWCGPCKMLSPVLEELSEEMNGKATIVKVDVDELGDIASRYRIMSIPALFVFKDGELKEKVVGFQPKQALTKLIERNL